MLSALRSKKSFGSSSPKLEDLNSANADYWGAYGSALMEMQDYDGGAKALRHATELAGRPEFKHVGEFGVEHPYDPNQETPPKYGPP